VPDNPFVPVLRRIRGLLGLGPASPSADAELLARFVLEEDETAFAALVERHAPLVWGVCRRVARDAHAAEDAFQATWIVLTRKAHSLRDGVSLPGWLHRVAYRLSLAARALPTVPLEDAVAETPGPEDEAALKEVREAIDEEVERLPEKYRLPVVLCFFEGRTHAEAAAELGWPVGTVAGRVARARDLLHRRLTRRGLAPSACLLPLAVPGAFPAVAGKASGAALALAAALLAGEVRRRWLVGAAVLLLSCVGVAAGVVVYRAMTPARPDDGPVVSKKDKPAWEPPLPPLDDGKPSPAARIPRTRIRVDGDVALSPDGSLLAGSRDGRVRLFDVRTNEEARALAGEVPGSAHALLFSPDGNWLAASGTLPSRHDGVKDIPGQSWVRVWDLASGEAKTLVTLPRQDRTFPVGFGPESETLVAAVDRKMQLWDLRSGQRLRSIQGGYGAMSPDGRTLATWDAKARATRLWEVPSGKLLFNLAAAGAPTFHPDSETVATVAADAVVRLWDRTTGQLKAVLDPCLARNKRPRDQLTPRELANDRPEGFPLDENFGGDSRLAWFSPDGEILASPSGQGEGVLTHLWSVRGTNHLRLVRGSFCAFSADSKTFAALVRVKPRDSSELPLGRWDLRSDYATRLWDVASGNSVFDMGGSGGRLLFPPDGKTIIHGATLCDARTGREQGALLGYDGGRLAFTRDSKALVSVSGQKATLWDVAKAEKQDVPGTDAASKDGRTVTLEKGATLELYSPTAPPGHAVTPREDRKEGPSLLRDERGNATPFVKDEHGKIMTLGDFARSGGLSNRAVSPNGKLRVELVGALDKDRQGELKSDNSAPLAVVEVAEGKGGPEGKYRGILAAAFSPDGKYLALGFQDGRILLWDISPTQPRSQETAR
jgi:RNA polymerase sigma factor (sigma-70 family)